MRFLILFIIVFVASPAVAQKEWATLRGTVTFVSDNGRIHADIGADVIVYYIDSVKPTGEKYEEYHREDSIINNSLHATRYYEMWEHSPIKKTQKEMVRKLKKMDAWPVEKVRDLDFKASIIIRERERRQDAKAQADVNGNYTIKLRQGYYGMIIRSKYLRTKSRTEGSGNILLDDAEMRAGKVLVRNVEIL